MFSLTHPYKNNYGSHWNCNWKSWFAQLFLKIVSHMKKSTNSYCYPFYNQFSKIELKLFLTKYVCTYICCILLVQNFKIRWIVFSNFCGPPEKENNLSKVFQAKGCERTTDDFEKCTLCTDYCCVFRTLMTYVIVNRPPIVHSVRFCLFYPSSVVCSRSILSFN